MNPCAHTMGTPDIDVFGAAGQFAAIGFRSMEIICASDYRCAIRSDWPADQTGQLKRHLASLNMSVACLTPYLRDICSLDREKYDRCMNEAKRVIQLAHTLETVGIRMLAGSEEHPTDEEGAICHLAEALGELCKFAEPYGVELWVENHMGTLACSAAATKRIVAQTGASNIGIVYDQANLTQLHAETYEEAIRIQAPYIRHVHVKDASWQPQGRIAKLLGEGQMPWEPIVGLLKEIGYDGCLCHEYERRWYPGDLPGADEGMAKGFRYLSDLIR
ncbi:MAG: sugar phosphate isomerase/epimerase [Cohnella sp.]|nr:sugar phosphate isomerase/epimerase [Cohnella sp.]